MASVDPSLAVGAKFLKPPMPASDPLTLIRGDCIEAMRTLPSESIDACVTDPPYELGFMAKRWDGTRVAFRVETWREVFRVLKPGAHLVAFGGTRTYHRMVCAIEDAGFKIRDQLAWVFGSGFPKSSNQEDEWEGWGTALKPAWEPIVLARKPFRGLEGLGHRPRWVGFTFWILDLKRRCGLRFIR